MKRCAISALSILVFVLGLHTAGSAKTDDRPWPKTVEEALDVLDREMPESTKRRLATLRPSCLFSMHFGWGMGLRNGLPIWGNDALIKDAGDLHPDSVSGVIMERYRNRLFSRLPKQYQERVVEFNRLLEVTKPAVSQEMTMADAVEEWSDALRKRRFELRELRQRAFEIRIKGAWASLKVPPDLFWQTSIAEFLDSEGRKMGMIYYEGNVLWLDSGEEAESKPAQKASLPAHPARHPDGWMFLWAGVGLIALLWLAAPLVQKFRRAIFMRRRG